MVITSLENKKIKEINKLKDKKYRDKVGKFIIETPNLIEEAYKEGFLLEVYYLEGLDFKYDVDSYEVSKEVLKKIKQTENCKIIGVCKKLIENEELGDKILLLDGVQDPGNLGTIIRSAVAFGIDSIIISLDSCDLYNDKVIRASEGNIFKINILRKDLETVICNIKNKGIEVYGTDVKNGIEVSELNNKRFAIVVGNEGSGISLKVKKLLEKKIYIKTKKVESLNVGVATSIILYELSK